MTTVEVRESEIEDIFAQYPLLLRGVLKLSHDIFLVARQKILPSSRLDLVYSHLSDLLLIELKVEPFQKPFVKQVLDYKDDLISMQRRGEFIKGDVSAVLLCPRVAQGDSRFARDEGVKAIPYDPGEVLLEFYRNAPLDTRYLSVQPTDKGVWRIGIINESLYLADKYRTIQEIATERRQSPKTISNQLRLAEELGLIRKERRKVFLSSYGEQYVRARDSLSTPDSIAREQATVIRTFILSDPFFSGVTFGILTMASSIFELSKNTYPVPLEMVSRHFISAAGLRYRWDTEKAMRKGVRMYTNYAIDLGLVGKVGNNYFVTPCGLNFVLLLNMHKSLKLIESTSRKE